MPGAMEHGDSRAGHQMTIHSASTSGIGISDSSGRTVDETVRGSGRSLLVTTTMAAGRRP